MIYGLEIQMWEWLAYKWHFKVILGEISKGVECM